MLDRPDPIADPSGWYAAMKRHDAQPVTVTGPAGTITTTYGQVRYLLDDLIATYELLCDIPTDALTDEIKERRGYLLDRLVETELLARSFIAEEDIPWRD